ncbi:GlsB/YeaQ/YmgE family stress response membrane protein [Rhodovulum iodosum]|nr:GlsB/YeaQ/YmgE family stress response membrane protein [Rhodovulum robiginosum]
MARLMAVALPLVTAGPALAQDETAQAVGTLQGGFIGLLIVVVIGAVVGWVASLIVKGSGSGFLGDVLFGIGGSILAGYVLPLLGISIGGTLGSLIAAVIGAVALILIVRLIRKAAR